MSRPVIDRQVFNPPKMKGFRPFGMAACKRKTIKLHYDEFESMHLADYDCISQEEAANRMNISRPTFTRIYDSALKKIARALVEGLTIEIDGGNIHFVKDWYRCKKCNKLIDGIENHIQCKNCHSYCDNELIKLM